MLPRRPRGGYRASAPNVIAVTRLGKGLVFRFPLPELPAHLAAPADDPDTTALLERTWTLLSH